jgi:hypothetical protein
VIVRAAFLIGVLGLLAGCGAPPRCQGPAQLPRVAACAVPEGGGVTGDSLGVTLSGRITQAGDGPVPDRCFAGRGLGNLADASEAAGAWWFRAPDADGRVWTIGVVVPGPRPVAAGQYVAVEYRASSGRYAPTVGWLEVRDATGTLVTWVGQGGDLPDLTLPGELAVTRGRPSCAARAACGGWRGYDLQIVAGRTEAPLPYAREVTVDGLRVVHGGYELATSFSGCADWYVANVVLAVTGAGATAARQPPPRPRASTTAPGPTS